MADYTGLECDIDKSREDGVQRLEIGGKEVDLCPGCWRKHDIDSLLEAGRDIPTGSARPARPSRSRNGPPSDAQKIKAWCEANHLESWRTGPTPHELRDAYAANNPAMVKHRYTGEGEPPTVGKLPGDNVAQFPVPGRS